MPSLLCLLPVLALQAQQLKATELSLGAAAALADVGFAGAELGVAHRPSSDSRIALAVAGGVAYPGEQPAVRAQLTLQFMLNSTATARTSAGFYAGVGAAFLGRRGEPGRGFVALIVGAEQSPGRKRGWFIESGFAGGVRVAVGWRARWFPSWWRGA